MNSLLEIKKAIAKDKVLTKAISRLQFYSPEALIQDAERYIKAVRTHRMLYHVSSITTNYTNIKFVSCEKQKNTNNYLYITYFQFMSALGYKESKNGYFRLINTGVNMVFIAHYDIADKLFELGILTKQEGEALSKIGIQTIPN